MNAVQRHPRNAAATRERVLAIAERAFARRGYEGVSLDDIAGEAGVRKATLFYYFASKADLYAEVARAVAARFAPLVLVLEDEPSLDALDRVVGSLHDVIAGAHDASVLLMREALDARSAEANSALQPFLDAATRWVRAGQKLGRFDAALPPRSAVGSIVGAVALPLLNPGLFRPDRESSIAFVRRAFVRRALVRDSRPRRKR
jgi:AcrR family transcriptional regulator